MKMQIPSKAPPYRKYITEDTFATFGNTLKFGNCKG